MRGVQVPDPDPDPDPVRDLLESPLGLEDEDARLEIENGSYPPAEVVLGKPDRRNCAQIPVHPIAVFSDGEGLGRDSGNGVGGHVPDDRDELHDPWLTRRGVVSAVLPNSLEVCLDPASLDPACLGPHPEVGGKSDLVGGRTQETGSYAEVEFGPAVNQAKKGGKKVRRKDGGRSVRVEARRETHYAADASEVEENVVVPADRGTVRVGRKEVVIWLRILLAACPVHFLGEEMSRLFAVQVPSWSTSFDVAHHLAGPLLVRVHSLSDRCSLEKVIGHVHFADHEDHAVHSR